MKLTTEKRLQFLIDNICADFTVDRLLRTARDCLAEGPCTTADISAAIMRKDPSLDKGCADGLTVGVAHTLVVYGEVKVEGETVSPAS